MTLGYGQKKNATAFASHCVSNWSDPGGARTLDPLIKSQLLYQLSYGVIVCSIATAKVLLFSKPATILSDFFEKKCIIGALANCSQSVFTCKTNIYTKISKMVLFV